MNSIKQKPHGGMARTQSGMPVAAPAMPEWWAAAPAGERRFLRGLARVLRGARQSRSPEVAQAAAKWERALKCFIKVRLMHERRVWRGAN